MMIKKQPTTPRCTLAATLLTAMLAAVSSAYATSDTWLGSTDTHWATSTNWSTSPATVPGTGDTATFNGAGNGNTTIDLDSGVTIGSILFDTASAAEYTIGSGGPNNQTLTLSTLNTGITMNSTVVNNQLFNANLALATTGNYTFTNNSTTNSLTLAGGISASTAGTKTLTVTGNGNTTISGAITNGSGTNNILVKTGTGTLTLSGANTYTGGTRANAGTTILSGSQTAGSFISVNNVGAQNAVLKLTSGAGTLAYLDINVAEATNARGAVYQQGGAFSSSGGIGIRVGSGATSYGYYNLSAGTLAINGAKDTAIGYGNGSTGVMDVTGGSLTAGSWIVLGRNGGTASGLLNVTGGSVTSTTNNIALNWGGTSGAISILNVGGGSGAATVTGASTATNYLDVSQTNTAGTTGVVNVLSNGTLTVGKVQASNAGSTALFNFNGGTLKATATNSGAAFMTSANVDAVTVYSGGGTIHNNGTNITIGNVLGAATGNGITSIAVTDGGSGYIGAPMVKITGGTGNTATGYAVMVDDGTGNGTFKVGSIVITSPGTYTVDPTTVTLSGGGASVAATIGSITTGANTSGGMSFAGSGTTTLSAANTYGGTRVSEGTLALSSNFTMSGANQMTIAATGTAGGTNYATLALTGSNTLNFGGTLVINFSSSILSGGETFNLFQPGSNGLFNSGFTGVSVAGSYVINALTGASGVWTGSASGFDFTFSESTGDLSVVASAIPEPATYAAILGSLALGAVALNRRRRTLKGS